MSIKTRLRIVSCVAIAAGCAATPSAPVISSATNAHEAGMVSIVALIPDIDLDIRYATRDNFVGERIRGYEAADCLLLEPVARALQRVEMQLRERQMRLRIFDCYRPVRAVQHFVEWAEDTDDDKTQSQHYPRLEKRALLGAYIAPSSGHSRGATIDLTLMRCNSAGTECAPLDMGTPFDFFDTRANTDSPEVTDVQRMNRDLLRKAMEQQSFHNYPLEWWHYTYQPEPSPGVAFDFPVR